MKDFSEEFKQLIEKYKNEGIEYGKPISYLEFRNGTSIKEMEKDLLEFREIVFTERQFKDSEKRYKSYQIYSSKWGRVYVVTFIDKIRIITIYPLGPSTVRRYRRIKFK